MMHQWIMGRRWNVIQTAPNSEALAATSAKEMGWVVFWPRYREKRVQPRRKPVEAILPYLPGYIFAADNRFLSLWELSKARGVCSVLKMGGEFIMVDDTDPVMEALLKMADNDGFVMNEVAKKPITLYKKGDKVIVDDGPFKSFPALVGEISKNKKIAQVWVTIFGRPTSMQLDIGQIKHAPAKKKIAA